MQTTSKKQTVYYHVTRFGDAAQILKTGKLICGRLNEDEEDSHRQAGYSARGYFVSLSRSMSGHYIRENLLNDTVFCVLMIDVEKIRGRFKLAPINFGKYERVDSEFEERIISDTKELDVSNAIVGVVFMAFPEGVKKENKVRIPRKLFPLVRDLDLFYVTRKNPVVKRPLNTKLGASNTTLTEAKRDTRERRGFTHYRVLVTPLNDLSTLSLEGLARYCSLAKDMSENDYSARSYLSPDVYDYVQSRSAYFKVQPREFVDMMLAAGEAAFVRKFNRWVGSLGEYFLSVVLRARRVRYTDDLFAIQAKVAKPILEVASSVNGVLTTDVNNLRFLIRVYEKLAAASKHYSAKQGVHSLVLSGTPCESQEHLAQFLFSGSSSVTKSLVNSIHNALLKL